MFIRCQPETYAPLQSSPQKQKEQTLELLVTWLRKDAEHQTVRVEFEDLHWADLQDAKALLDELL